MKRRTSITTWRWARRYREEEHPEHVAGDEPPIHAPVIAGARAISASTPRRASDDARSLGDGSCDAEPLGDVVDDDPDDEELPSASYPARTREPMASPSPRL